MRIDGAIHLVGRSARWTSCLLFLAFLLKFCPYFPSLKSNPRWTRAREMLTRSKMAKLTFQVPLHLSTTYQWSSKAVQAFKSCLSHMKPWHLEEIENIRSLSIDIFQDLPKSSPQLHSSHIIENILLSGYHPTTPYTMHEDFLCEIERLQCVKSVQL